MADPILVTVVAGGAVRLYSQNGEALAEWGTIKGELGPEDAARLTVNLAAFMASSRLDLEPEPALRLALPRAKRVRRVIDAVEGETPRERKLRLDRERKRERYAQAKGEPVKQRGRRVVPGQPIIPSTHEAAAAVLAHPGLTTTELRELHPTWGTHSSVMLHNATKRAKPQIRKADGRWWPLNG